MKRIEIEDMESMGGERLEENDSFAFRCGPDVSCFGRCCRNLNLFLQPYDVVRLRKNLNMPSGRFVEDYTDLVLRPSSHFPDVLLRMKENDEKTCPFLTDKGCSVYPDRPDTCRMFPIEHGVLYGEKAGEKKSVYIFRPPEFCMGKHENAIWTPHEWTGDQEAESYNRMTRRWGDVKRFFVNDPWNGQGPEGPKGKMAFMAAYNVDAFREFVFKSSFLNRYKVKHALISQLERDDETLLEFAFQWILHFLWNVEPDMFSLKTPGY